MIARRIGWLPALLLTSVSAGAREAPAPEGPAAATAPHPAVAPQLAATPPPAAASGAVPLTLRDCLRIAAARSERVARARQDHRQALALRGTARSAVLPRLRLENVYFQQNEVEIAPTGGVGSAFAFSDTRNDLFLRLEQPIFRGLRERNLLASARENIEAAVHGVDEALRLLYADVAQAFYSALQKQGEVETLADTVAVERERLREVAARRDVGLARRTDYLLAEAQLGEDEANLTRARNELEVALQRLAFLLGEPPAGPLSDDVEISAELGDTPPSTEDALARRSDMKQLERRVAAARHRLAAARGEYYPSVDLEGRAYVDRHNVSTFAEETDWTAEITVSVPVFDGGRARAGVLDASAALERATLDREELARQVALEVETAWRTLQSDLARLRTLETSLASAEENYRLVEEEYRGGLATNLEVIAAQNLLLSTRLQRERQRYQVKLDAVALDLARGVMEPEAAE
jgi:outer membrane protein